MSRIEQALLRGVKRTSLAPTVEKRLMVKRFDQMDTAERSVWFTSCCAREHGVQESTAYMMLSTMQKVIKRRCV